MVKLLIEIGKIALFMGSVALFMGSVYQSDVARPCEDYHLCITYVGFFTGVLTSMQYQLTRLS